MGYSIPDSKSCFENILQQFDILTKEYSYEIISTRIEERVVEIFYENKSICRKIEISNHIGYTDYGFSIFIYNSRNQVDGDYNIIVNVPWDKQDKECIFIKNSALHFFSSCKEMINGTDWVVYHKIPFQL